MYIVYIIVKKIRNPETGRMVNLTGKIGQKVLSQRGGGTEIPDEKNDPEGYKNWLNKFSMTQREADKLAKRNRQARLLHKATAPQRGAKAAERDLAKGRARINKRKVSKK